MLRLEIRRFLLRPGHTPPFGDRIELIRKLVGRVGKGNVSLGAVQGACESNMVKSVARCLVVVLFRDIGRIAIEQRFGTVIPLYGFDSIPVVDHDRAESLFNDWEEFSSRSEREHIGVPTVHANRGLAKPSGTS